MLRPRGVLAASMTPFDEAYQLDETALRQSFRRLVPGTNGLVGPAAVAERISLTFEEWQRWTDIMLEVAHEAGVPGWAYFGTESFEKTLPYAEYAAEAGADGVMIVSPHWHHFPPATVHDYLADFAGRFPTVPFVANLNIQTGTLFPASTFARLAEIPNMVGVKFSPGLTLHHILDILRLTESTDLAVITVASALYPLHAVGVRMTACVSPETNFAHDEVLQLWDALQREDLVTARRIYDWMIRVDHAQLHPRVHFTNIPAGHKAALEMMGTSLGPPRRPLARPEGEFLEQLEEELGSAGLRAATEVV